MTTNNMFTEHCSVGRNAREWNGSAEKKYLKINKRNEYFNTLYFFWEYNDDGVVTIRYCGF